VIGRRFAANFASRRNFPGKSSNAAPAYTGKEALKTRDGELGRNRAEKAAVERAADPKNLIRVMPAEGDSWPHSIHW
jgi:hypothetical protein